MKETTIELSEETQQTLQQIALQTGCSESELIREAIKDYLERKKSTVSSPTSPHDVLLRLREIGRRMPLVDAVQLAQESREQLEQRGDVELGDRR